MLRARYLIIRLLSFKYLLAACVIVIVFRVTLDRSDFVKRIAPASIRTLDGPWWAALLIPVAITVVIDLRRKGKRSADESIVARNIVRRAVEHILSNLPSDPIRLSMQASPHLATTHHSGDVAPLPLSDLSRAYDRSGGIVLLLGDRGAGKTTALARLIADRVVDRQEQHLPILVDMMGWNGDPLEYWLPRAVHEQYQGITLKVAQQFAETHFGWVLDNVDRNKDATHLMGYIKTYVQARTCRLVVAIGPGLSRQTLQSLGADQVYQVLSPSRDEAIKYLRKQDAGIAAINAVARASSKDQFLRLPLFLNFLSGLTEIDMTLLNNTPPSQRQERLVDLYVSQQLSTMRANDRFQLEWVADSTYKRGTNVFLPDRINETWLPTGFEVERARRGLVGTLVTAGLLVGVGILMLNQFVLDAHHWNANWFPCLVVLFATSSWTLFGYFFLKIYKGVHPVEAVSWAWLPQPFGSVGRFARLQWRDDPSTVKRLGTLAMYQGGIQSLLLFVIVGSLAESASFSADLSAGFYLFIIPFVASTIEDRLVPRMIEERTPFSALRRSAAHAVLSALIVTAATFIISIPLVRAILGSGADSRSWTLIALDCAIFFGAMQGLTLGGYAILRYVVARASLFVGGYLPLRLRPFFVSQAKGSLLLPQGSGYTFAHSLVQENLSRRYWMARVSPPPP